MGLSGAMMIYGGCLYFFPTLTITATLGTASFIGTRIILPLVIPNGKTPSAAPQQSTGSH